MTRTLKPMVGALIEPVVARSDCVSLRRASAYVLCNSAFSAEEIKRAYGITAHVSYLGVDPGRFRPGASTAKTSKAELGRVVSVGTVARLKRHDMVIEALGRLPRGTRPALQVVGAGNDAQYVDTLIDLAKQNAVQLDIVRHATDVELVAAYQSAWATVCASDLEPFGLTALESISCGTPVIAVREGGFREIVTEGVTGYLVEPDIEGLTDGIARLRVTRSDFDPAALHESITADAWTWDDAVDRLHDHFRRALDSDKRQLHT